MGFLSRLPSSNENSPEPSNSWGNQNPDVDDFFILLNEEGKRCRVCQRVILNCHLTKIGGNYYCPDHKPKGE